MIDFSNDPMLTRVFANDCYSVAISLLYKTAGQFDMEAELDEKNLERERLVFFCDAVIAIAITLLVLDLKVDNVGTHFSFSTNRPCSYTALMF